MNVRSIKKQLENAFTHIVEDIQKEAKNPSITPKKIAYSAAIGVAGGAVHAFMAGTGASAQGMLGIHYENLSEIMKIEFIGAATIYGAILPLIPVLPTPNTAKFAILSTGSYLMHTKVGHMLYSLATEPKTTTTDSMCAIAAYIVPGIMSGIGFFAYGSYKENQKLEQKNKSNITQQTISSKPHMN
jgi:hypothetical protein